MRLRPSDICNPIGDKDGSHAHAHKLRLTPFFEPVTRQAHMDRQQRYVAAARPASLSHDEEDPDRWISLPARSRWDLVARRPPLSPLRKMLLLALFGGMSLFFAYGLVLVTPPRLRSMTSSQQVVLAADQFILQESWAQYSPYFTIEPYRFPPSGCRVVQANILQRHGARYPTAGAAAGIVAAVAKLKRVKHFADPRLAFLATWSYDLGTDALVQLGAQEARYAGALQYSRYGRLVSERNLPFVRASGSERVVLSAVNWTIGFSLASNHKYNPKLSVIMSEAKDSNNTLDDNGCPSAGDSSKQTQAWLALYGAPIAARLNAQAPGANLTAEDVYGLMSLCPFETVSAEALSPFCALFSEPEFEQYEYHGDLDKYYNTGYGQPLGRVQGVGYVNELIARLTGNPVQDATQTNRTLTSNPATFPLNRTLYADFSHDNAMIAVYAALGLVQQQRAPLDPLQPDPRRTWRASLLVPFSARMVVEKLRCERDAGGRRAPGEYVRVLINDALQDLPFCGVGEERDEGLCALDAFVQSQAYARGDGDGDFEKCFFSSS